MTRDCPVCKAEDAVEYTDDEPFRSVCKCEECGARFMVEVDADFNGDHYVDCSTVGKRIDNG